MVAVYPPPSAERRDLLARALRDMLAQRLEVHPSRLGGLSAAVVAAMLEELSEPQAVAARGRREPWPSPPVVTPDWDSRAG